MKGAAIAKSLPMIISALPIFASHVLGQGFISSRWSDVCRVAAGSELIVTVANGTTVRGRCRALSRDEIQISRTFGRTAHIARTAISGIEIKTKLGGGDRVSSLQDQIGFLLQLEGASILTPFAPLGLLAITPTMVWGIVGTPICGIMDLVQNHRSQKRQIRFLAESYPTQQSNCNTLRSSPAPR